MAGKHITICDCTTVRDIEESIRDKEGLPPEQIRLLCAGRELEDDESAPQKGSTRQLVWRLRGEGGGMSVPRDPPKGDREMPIDMIHERPNTQIKGSNPTNEEKLTRYWLLSPQSLAVHWNNVSPAWRFTGKQPLTLKNIEDLEIATEAKNHAYHTRLAIALLRRHFAERREAWALEQKAMSWLSSLSKAMRWEEISEIITQV